MEYWTVTRRELRGEPGKPKIEFVWHKPTYGVLKKYGSTILEAFLDELKRCRQEP